MTWHYDEGNTGISALAYNSVGYSSTKIGDKLINVEDDMIKRTLPIEIEIENNIYLIKQNNQYYTFNGTNIVKSPSQELDEDNFKTNGFDEPTLISESVWDNTFPDKTGLKLLMWTDDTTKTNTSMAYNTDNYKIIDKLAADFEIKMYKES